MTTTDTNQQSEPLDDGFPWIVSPDDHVVEPPDLWANRLPAAHRAVGPRVVRQRGTMVPARGGFSFEPSDAPGSIWADVWHYEDTRTITSGAAAAAGVSRDKIHLEHPVLFEEMRPGSFRQAERLSDMDMAGIEASLCFPNTFVRFCGQRFLWAQDKSLALLCVRAYNDFILDEWCAGSNGRLIPCGIIPLWDPQAAAREVERIAARGARAITFTELPSYLGLPSIYTSHWDPVFAACEANGVVVMIHVGSSSQVPTTSSDAPFAVMQALASSNSAAALVDWLCAAIPVRFPGLQLCMAECNIGWVPYFLERLDLIWSHNRSYAGISDLVISPPSTYFASNVSCTFFSDEFGLTNVEAIGVNNVMFETDYPHGDSTWPDSRRVGQLQAAAAGISSEVTERVMRGNARRLFRLDDPDRP